MPTWAATPPRPPIRAGRRSVTSAWARRPAGGDWFNSGGVGPGTTVLSDLAEYTLGLVSMYHDVQTVLTPHTDLATKLGALGDVLVQGGLDVLMLTGEGEELRGAELSGRTADELTRAAVKASEWTDDAAKAGL